MGARAYCRECDGAVDTIGPWPGRCGHCGGQIETRPVPPLVEPHLRLVLVGSCHGVEDARRRLPFTDPEDRIWEVLDESHLTPERFEPVEAERLLRVGVGATTVCTRAAPDPGDLGPEDRTHGRDRLAEVLDRFEPERVAFLGIRAYELAAEQEPMGYGPVPEGYRGRPAFVVPATHPGEADVDEATLAEWFERLRNWLDRPRRGPRRDRSPQGPA